MNPHHTLLSQQENGGFFEPVAEFNLYLIRYIHKSWLDALKLSPLVYEFRKAGCCDYHLSQFLLKEFNVYDEFDYDFNLLAKRVVLCDESALSHLSLNLGIVLNEFVIRNIVKREEKKGVEECLGKETYLFAVKKAQFIRGSMGFSDPSLLIDTRHPEKLKKYLLTCGFQVLGKAFSDCSDAFLKRLSLKIPKQFSSALYSYDQMSDSVKNYQFLVVKTHKEVNRKWRHLLL